MVEQLGEITPQDVDKREGKEAKPEPTPKPKAPESNSPPAPSGQVFISPEELAAIEARVVGKAKSEDEAQLRAQVAADVKQQVAEAQARAAAEAQQKAMQKEQEDRLAKLEAELAAVKESANRPQRQGMAAPSGSPFVTTQDGRKALTREAVDAATREWFNSKR